MLLRSGEARVSSLPRVGPSSSWSMLQLHESVEVEKMSEIPHLENHPTPWCGHPLGTLVESTGLDVLFHLRAIEDSSVQGFLRLAPLQKCDIKRKLIALLGMDTDDCHKRARTFCWFLSPQSHLSSHPREGQRCSPRGNAYSGRCARSP